MVGQSSFFCLKDNALLPGGQPIEELLKADDVIFVQISIGKRLQPLFFIIGAISVNDRTHE